MGSQRPRAESEFVEDVLVALKKRSKALKHKSANPDFNRFLEEIDGEQVERVEVDFDLRSKQRLKLTLWGDRMVEVRAVEPNPDKGWKFDFRYFGRALGEANGRILVAAIEDTLHGMFELTQAKIDRLEKIWSPLLAQGPQSV